MKLGKLIETLEKEPKEKVVKHGFDYPHSYRGYYDQLAFEPAENVTVDSMLACAKSAVGATYGGWKGGEYLMDEDTDVWLAEVGCTGETIGPMLLAMMLASGDEA